MKKTLFAILALAAIVACNKADIIDQNPGEAIQFGNAFVDNSTKATSATDPSYSTTGKGVALEQFNVYGAVNGVNIFAGNTVTKDGAAYGSAWTLEGTKQYWIAGADYKFVGVVDGSKTGVTVITPDAAGLPSKITYTADGATDLLCDVVTVTKAGFDANGNATDYSLVAFNYTHLLSKINFAVKNTTDASNYRFVLTSAKLTNAYESAEYDVNADEWTPAANMREFTLENLTINSNATQYHSKEILLIPGSAVGVYVKANIEAKDNDTDWTVVSTVEKTFENALGKVGEEPKTLERAKAYNFIVELGVGTEIQFTAAEMPEWGNGNTVDTNKDNVNDTVIL